MFRGSLHSLSAVIFPSAPFTILQRPLPVKRPLGMRVGEVLCNFTKTLLFWEVCSVPLLYVPFLRILSFI